MRGTSPRTSKSELTPQLRPVRLKYTDRTHETLRSHTTVSHVVTDVFLTIHEDPCGAVQSTKARDVLKLLGAMTKW